MVCLSKYLCVLLVLVAPLALGGESRPKDRASLAGHYYLKSGPSETGSELLLKDFGQFEWALMYSAVDYGAKGTWQVTGKRLVLSPAASPEPVFRIFGDDEYRGTKPAEPGRWIAMVGVPGMGPVADIEVLFEARSGNTATAVSKPNGDAIVAMPPKEVWMRAGLRRGGSKKPWQWFSVASQGSQSRIVGFVLTNLAAVQHAPFSSLTLRIDPSGLVIDDDMSGLCGTYAKP
jgi:hypothetical protein